MWLLEVACPRPVQAPASSQCQGQPAVPAPMLMAPAEAYREAQKKRVRARWRRQKQSKALKLEVQNSPKIESKPEAVVEDQSKRGSTTPESKPKVRVEAGSARRIRNLGFQRYCRL